MAAKKKASSSKAAKRSTAAATATPTPTRTVKASADVASIEEPARAPQPVTDKVQTPTIDPTLSHDNRHSTYVDANDKFPPDTGNQVEEIPGKPTSER